MTRWENIGKGVLHKIEDDLPPEDTPVGQQPEFEYPESEIDADLAHITEWTVPDVPKRGKE